MFDFIFPMVVGIVMTGLIFGLCIEVHEKHSCEKKGGVYVSDNCLKAEIIK